MENVRGPRPFHDGEGGGVLSIGDGHPGKELEK